MERQRKTHCANGHELTDENRIKDGRCKICQYESVKKWTLENQEKVKESKRKWYEANKENADKNSRKWKAENQGKVKEIHRKWRAENQEKIKEKNRKWQEANPERAKERGRRYGLKIVDRLADKYLATLGFKDAPEEIKELKRLHLTLKREIKKCKQSKQ